MISELLDAIEDVSSDPRSGRWVPHIQPLDDTEKVGVGRFCPVYRRHDFGATSRSNAATTVA
jgi:hypothetical protein